MTGIDTGAIGAVALLALVIAALVIVLYLIPVRIWIAAFASGAYVGLFTLVGMRLRRVPPSTIVTARISAVKAGLDHMAANVPFYLDYSKNATSYETTF